MISKGSKLRTEVARRDRARTRTPARTRISAWINSLAKDRAPSPYNGSVSAPLCVVVGLAIGLFCLHVPALARDKAPSPEQLDGNASALDSGKSGAAGDGSAAQSSDETQNQGAAQDKEANQNQSAGLAEGTESNENNGRLKRPNENARAPAQHQPFKLQASQSAATEGAAETNPNANPFDAAPTSPPRFSGRASGLDSLVTDPLAALKATLGNKHLKAYAECDTGYGVCGVVLNVPVMKGYTSIRRVYPYMPAALAGIRPGDIVVAVNGQSTLYIPPSHIWDYFTGAPGSPVSLVIRRGGEQFQVTLQRMDIGRIPDTHTRSVFLTLFHQNGMSHLMHGDQ